MMMMMMMMIVMIVIKFNVDYDVDEQWQRCWLTMMVLMVDKQVGPTRTATFIYIVAVKLNENT